MTAATGSTFFSSSAGGLSRESESESLSLESESEEVAEEDSDLAGLAGSLFSSSFFSPLSESESEEDESESEDESEDAGAVLAFLAAGSSPESLSLSLSLSDSESDAASLRLIPLRGKALEEVSRSAKAMDATRRGGDAGTEGCCPAAAAAPISKKINISQPSAGRAAGRGGSVTHLASMYTLAISTRSVLMACEVETGRRGQRGSHFAGRAPHPATAAAEKNCDFRERFGRTHRLGRRHLLGARLDLSALRVALRPFASRYASTDGTRSAAFAVATGVTACMVVDAESSAPQSEEEPGATIGAKRSLVVEFFASAVVRWFGGVLTNHVDGKVWIGLAIAWKQ